MNAFKRDKKEDEEGLIYEYIILLSLLLKIFIHRGYFCRQEVLMFNLLQSVL